MYKKWDMDTCTPADYTIQIRISDDQYEEYKSMLDGGEKRKIDEIITEKLEEEVKGLLEKYHSDNCNPEDACQIATITFGYKNGELIRALQKRGLLIGYGQFHKVREVDDLINDIIRDSKEQLQQPVCAFVTFNSYHAHKVCEDRLFKYMKTIDR